MDPAQPSTARGEPAWQTLRVSRPGLWATQVWFYLLPLGGRDVFGRPEFWVGALYLTFPFAYLLYGWNDSADYATDRANPRKGNLLFGAKLPEEDLRRLPLRIALVQAPFLAYFFWVVGPKILVWAAAVAALNAAYNWPRVGLKGLPVLDVLVQSSYLLVFVLSSWLNDAPQAPWQTFLFGALFAMHAHLLNEVADIEPDRAAGRRTTAVALGVGRTKLAVAAGLLVEAVLVATQFDNPAIAALLALGAVIVGAEYALRGDKPLSERVLRDLLIAWNVVAVASLYPVWRYAVFVTG